MHHERIPPKGWVDRRSTERRSEADTPIRIIRAALCAYGNPTSAVFARRGISVALALRVLTKPNRSRTARTRKASTTK